jgi:conjugal transfer/entry exclusion protein
MIDAMKDAAAGLPAPPACVRLRPDDVQFYESIVRARARSDWSESHLILAAQLARTMNNIEQEEIKLENEGSVRENDKGTLVANQRVNFLAQLKQSQLATIRALALHATANKTMRQIGNKDSLAQNAMKAREEIEHEDDLIAR